MNNSQASSYAVNPTELLATAKNSSAFSAACVKLLEVRKADPIPFLGKAGGLLQCFGSNFIATESHFLKLPLKSYGILIERL